MKRVAALRYNGKVENKDKRWHGLQNLKYLLLGALQEKFANPCCRARPKELVRTGQAHYKSRSYTDNQPSFFTQKFGNFV